MCVLSNVIVCTKEERAGKCEKKKERERGSQRKEGREGRELVLEREREREEMATTTLVPMPPLAPREVSERAATPRRIIVEESSLANGNAGAMPVVVSQQQQQQQQWAFDVLGDYGEYLDGLRREGGGDEDESTGAGVDAEVDGGNKSPTVGRLDVGALPEDIAFAAEQLGSRDPAMSSLIINTYRRKKLEREAIHEYASNVKETTTMRDESGTIGGGRGAPSPSVYLIKNGSSATTTGAGVGAAAAAGVGGGMEMSASHRQESALDTYLDMRQERALRRWEHYCELWERERKKLHANLDLPSEHPYIMDSADEYRKKIETLDALDRAVPLEERHGSDQWTMSLRNNWARYVPVGNIFSGLFCPVEERQRGFDDLIKVGKPKSSATAASDPQRVRGWHQSSHLALRLMQFSKRVEGFPKYNPDMTQLEVQGRGVVEELLDLADKQVRRCTSASPLLLFLRRVLPLTTCTPNGNNKAYKRNTRTCSVSVFRDQIKRRIRKSLSTDLSNSHWCYTYFVVSCLVPR